MKMEPKEKAELIQLIEEQRAKKVISPPDETLFVGDDNHLSGLLSQLETLNGEGELQQPDPPVDPKKGESDIAIEAESSCGDDRGKEEIIRELKKVQKQNFITHCLLSVMITLTVAWQLSEATLFFKVKNGLNNPFKSIGSILTGMMGPSEIPKIADTETGTKQQQIECPPIPPLELNIPELPHFDLKLGLDSEKH